MGSDLGNELYDVEFDAVEAITALAWLLRLDDGCTHWLPKSRCHISHDDGGKGILTAPAWLLDEKEIHYEL